MTVSCFPHRATLAVLLGVMMAVGACGDEPKSGGGRRGRGRRGRSKKAKAEEPKPAADQAEAEADLVGQVEEEPYEYNENFTGRDPFRSHLRDFVARDQADRSSGIADIRTALENFDMNELRPIAIITGTPVPKAMLTDPSGLGHVVKPGTRVGRKGGRIVRIAANSIVIRHIDDEFGSVKETVIRLHDTDEAAKYRLNVVRHELETDERDKGRSKAMDDIDADKFLKQPGQRAAPGATPGAAPTSGGERGY